MAHLKNFETYIVDEKFGNYKELWKSFDIAQQISISSWFYNKTIGPLPTHVIDGKGANTGTEVVPEAFRSFLVDLKTTYHREKDDLSNMNAGSRRRRRPSRKYKKSAKRVFRKKSRSTRRR
jgi:hypothetical protein